MRNNFKMWKYVALLSLILAGLCLASISQNNQIQAASVTRLPWMNENTLWPVGVNLAWYHWDNDFLDSGWESRFAAIQSQFDIMAKDGVHAVRWWVFPDGNVAPLWSGSGEGSLCTGLPQKWVDHMVEMADYAKSKEIRIYFCFTSFDWGYNDRTWNHDDIFDNKIVRQSFLEKAVKPILQALGKHPGILGWDVINEPEWLIASADGGDPNGKCEYFSLANMQGFAKDVVSYVHQYAQQPVSVGSASMKWCGGQYQFWKGLGLDFYDFHWYDWATPYFNPLKKSPSDLGLDKPCIIGEMMPNPSNASIAMTHQEVLEAVYANGYSGYMPWAWNDNANDCKSYIKPSFSNFEAAHPEVNQILSSGAATASPTATVGVTASPTVTPSPSATASATATVAPTSTATATTASYTVVYTIQNQWGSGATVYVTIKNNTESAVNGWNLAWTFSGDQKIGNMWNASYTQHGSSVTASNASYNSTIAAKGSVTFGFNLSCSALNNVPTAFTLNGAAI